MSYSILRVEKVKNANVIRALQRHNQRENKNYGNTDIDLSKSHLNYDLIHSEKIQYTKEIEKRIEEGYTGKRKIRNDAIKLVDGIITSDKEFFDKLSKKQQDQFFKDSLEFLKKEYGEKNIIYATVHYDEKTPHMHFGFVPLTEDGRLSAKEILGNKVAMSKLQDRFNDFINEKGYNLERGEKDTGRKHIEMMKFKEQTLNKEIQKLQQNLEAVRKIDERIKQVDDFDRKTKRILNQVTMNKADFEAFKNIAKAGMATIQKFEDLKTTSTETFQELNQKNQVLEKENEYLMSRNYRLQNENQKLKKENDELKSKIKALNREIERYRTFVRNFGERVKEGMIKLAEKLKTPKLYEAFKEFVFEPAKKISNEEYLKDRQQEKKELALERNKGDLER
jgi:uncharacterized protein YlxW (UPF0749 family)